MTHRSVANLILVLAVAATARPAVAAVQQAGEGVAGRGPQFLLAVAGRSEPARLDVRSTPVLRRNLFLEIENATIADALAEISRQSGLNLVYAADAVVPAGPRVTLRAEAITVAAALTHVLLDAGVDVVFTTNDVVTLVSQQPTERLPGTITGQVVEATSRRPLVGAQISVPGTGIGGVTNSAGRYQIAGVPSGQVTVRAQMIGYQSAEDTIRLAAGQSVALDFELTERALALDEIVVTGTAGGQQVRSLGNAIATIDAAELTETVPPANMLALLSAKVPGVRILESGGEIGSGGFVRIRGASSMSLLGQPLLYIDGVRVNNNSGDGGGVGSDGSNPPSRINDLNPEDIASIEVIKGPAAATLYGTEASNGVIQIITKRGARGEPTVDVQIKQGANWLPNPTKLFPPAYYTCRGFWDGCTPGEIVEFNVLAEDAANGVGPWFTTGYAQAYGARVSGGTERLLYYFSADYNRDEGALSYNWLNQLSGRANLRYTPNDRLDLSLSLGTVRSRTSFASPQQPITTAIIWSCPMPGCEPGSGAPNAADGPTRGYLLYLPERFEDEMEGFEDLDRTTLSLRASHQPFEWFTHRLEVGGDHGATQSSELMRPLPEGVSGMLFVDGRKQMENRRFNYFNIDYGATATVRPLEDLSVATSGGVQYYKKQTSEVFAEGEILAVRQLETITAGAIKTASEDFLENKTIGVYLQEQLSWRDRIFLTGAVRGDDNSAFGTNFDFVVYPKFQASWVLGDESFVDLPWLNQLKLRGAWGKAGQQPDIFAALRTYEPQIGENGVPTLTPENVGNSDLEPEVGEELEVGFDASLFDDRLGLHFTYYNQRTTNAIVEVPVLPSEGFPGTRFQNIGEIANKGLEFAVQANAHRSPNLNIDLGLTFSTNRSEVVDIGGGAPILMSSFTGQYHLPDFPIASIFQRRVVSADIDATGSTPRAVNVMCEGGPLLPGATDLSRGGGEPVPCAEAPRVYWGQPLPTWEGGINATVTLFRNFQLYGLVDFMGGNEIINGDMHFAHFLFGNTREIHERDDPILLGYETTEGAASVQPGIIDGGFAKLRNVSATYTLPQSWVERFGMSRASITLSARNLGVLWWAQKTAFGVKQIDPETRQTGGLGLSAFFQEGWPQLRRFMTTLRVTL